MKVLHTCNSISPGSTDAHHLCLLVHSAPHPSHPSLPLCNVFLFQHVNMLPSLHFLEKSTSQSVSQFHRSVVSNSLRPHESQHARPPCPSPTPEITQTHIHQVGDSIKLVMPSSHLILCRPLLLLPPIPPSIRVFSNESTLRMRWPKYWSFSSASVLPMNTQG